MYSRGSSRRPVTPPPDYSGVLFEDNMAEKSNVTELSDTGRTQNEKSVALPVRDESGTVGRSRHKPVSAKTESIKDDDSNRGVTLPLAVPELSGIGECIPRFPLTSRRQKKYSVGDSCPICKPPKDSKKSAERQNPLASLLENTGKDELLLAALIFMMLEFGVERNMILLLALLLI